MFWSSSTIRMTVLSGKPVSLLFLGEGGRGARGRRAPHLSWVTRKIAVNADQMNPGPRPLAVGGQ